MLLKIQANNIDIINVKNEVENIGGINLYHGYTKNIIDKLSYLQKMNYDLFYKKKRYLEANNTYLELSDCKDFIEMNKMYDKLNTY